MCVYVCVCLCVCVRVTECVCVCVCVVTHANKTYIVCFTLIIFESWVLLYQSSDMCNQIQNLGASIPVGALSCTSWIFCLVLVPVRRSLLPLCEVLCFLCKDVLLRHTLANWCSLRQIKHFSPYAGHSFGLWVSSHCPWDVSHGVLSRYLHAQPVRQLHISNLLFGQFWSLRYLCCLAKGQGCFAKKSLFQWIIWQSENNFFAN